jgi:cytochrome c-type biogenesis protein CcmF
VDLGLNAYLVVFMVGFLGLGLFWLGYRYAGIKVPEVNKKLVSREFMVFLAMLILAVVSALVLLGTSSPLFTRLWGDPAAVSMDYYNRITFPLGVALAVLLGIYPYFMWHGEGTHVGQKIAVAVLLSLAGTALAFRFGVRDIGYVIFAWAALFAFFGNALYLLFFFRKSWYRAGSYVAHLGFGLLLLGILVSSAFSTSRKIELREGDVRSALGYDFKYLGKSQDQGSGRGTLDVAVRNGDEHFMAYPRFYWSEYTQGYMRKPHIRKTTWYDIYVAPEEHYASGESPGERFGNTLQLVKGQTKTYDQVEYTFHDFDLGSHASGAGEMRVTANITATRYGGPAQPIAPYLELGADDQRREGPAQLSDGTTIRLTRIQADAGAILLEFEKPGQPPVQEASLLVLQVSRKPLVSLVWLGSIMVLAGTLLALYYRGRSAPSTARHAPAQRGAEHPHAKVR